MSKNLQIQNNFTGEILTIDYNDKEQNELVRLKKKLIDNRFISLVLARENRAINSLFLTITTTVIQNIEQEINSLETVSTEILDLLKKHKIQYTKNYELTKQNTPHLHFQIFDTCVKNDIEEILKKHNNRTNLQEIKKEDNSKIANYNTKYANFKKDFNTNIETIKNFEDILKSKKLKLFTSSRTKTFNKKDRSIMYSAFLLYEKAQDKKTKKYESERFIDFCFKYVLKAKNKVNMHIKNNFIHFTIVEDKIYYKNIYRVNSKYSRVGAVEKEEVINKHNNIIDKIKRVLSKTKKNKTKTKRTKTKVKYYYKNKIKKSRVKLVYKVFKPPP